MTAGLQVTPTPVDLGTLWLPTGAIAESVSRNQAELGDKTVLASGTLQLVAVSLAAGDVVSTIKFCAGATPAGTPLNQWACLVRESDLAVLGKSLDDTTNAWSANKSKPFTLSAPVTITATGRYYAGLVVVATTPPTLRGVASNNDIAGQVPAMTARSTTGLTTPGSLGATAATLTAANSVFYAALF